MTDPAIEPGEMFKVAFAHHIGRSERMIETYARQGMPRSYRMIGGRERMVIDVEAAETWIATNVRDQEPGELDAQKKAAELRKLELQGDKLSLEVALKTGKVLQTEDVHREWAGRVVAVTKALDALPAAVAPLCEGRPASEVRAILEGEVRRIRNEFAAGNAPATPAASTGGEPSCT